MQIDPSQRGHMPAVEAPTLFTPAGAPAGGWRVRIPGGRPLATAAVAEGRVFLGGGFGSYDFYAFDAESGRVQWQYQTEDDGPTAAVVAEERVVFNTESCELEVLTTAGQRVWKKWLGDPLMSIPAVGDGRVFMAYPDTRGDRRHYLACFALADGRELWKHPIAGEIITCPVLADGEVYVSCLDGTIACFGQLDGQLVWQETRNATSTPAVWRRQCYFSQRRERAGTPGHDDVQQMEALASKLSAVGTPVESFLATEQLADYLDHSKRQTRSSRYARQTAYDSAVGFGGHKGDAKIEQAMRNLGHGHVSAVWAYQGSKPFVAGGRLYSGMGDTLHCADPDSRDVYWTRKLGARPDGQELLDSTLTPPATLNGKLFLGTIDGEVLCLSAANGETLWSVSVGEPVLFQPTVVAGRVYVTTGAGSLICLETGDPADDGWHMWGATPAHNGLPEEVDAALVV